ncbi:hypothetical protein GWI33_008200 [Rhynchophorus ferrugineus]|uniref:Uncharacterized protein n=1 Tax=Rhynchophorus ferrugineus TaxID=354439 RepID=A0A834MG24_RHYFE|nr:hypothetical protein GWI33_008200 [Rhynchophorus ferrugineus]
MRRRDFASEIARERKNNSLVCRNVALSTKGALPGGNARDHNEGPSSLNFPANTPLQTSKSLEEFERRPHGTEGDESSAEYRTREKKKAGKKVLPETTKAAEDRPNKRTEHGMKVVR